MTPRRCVYEALSSWSPARTPNHVGQGPGLVPEHEPACVHEALPRSPAATGLRDIGPVLLGGSQRLFWCERPRRRIINRIVERAATWTLCSFRASWSSAKVMLGLVSTKARSRMP